MNLRFGAVGSHPSVYRRYTLDEMLDVFCRLTENTSRCREIGKCCLYPYPFWRRVRVRVSDLTSQLADLPTSAGKLPKYMARREMGGRFPPVILTPVKNPLYNEQNGLDIFPQPHGWHIQEGNHRVRIAQAVGDEWIDAFVSCEDGS